MWKRDEAVRQPAAPTLDAAAAAAPAAARQATRPDPMPSQNGRDVVNIGKSVVIKGELNGSEDLTIEGHVEGEVSARDMLTVSESAVVNARVSGSTIVILGTVTGDVVAATRLEIRAPGRVIGDVTTPSLVINEGASLEGRCSMRSGQGTEATRDLPAALASPPKLHAS